MPSPSETAHVQWLLKEKVRLDRLIASAAERKKKIDEDTKRHRKMRTEVNKMIALYGTVDADEDTTAVAQIEGRIKCPECTATFANKAGVGAHLRTVHGIYGGLSGRGRPDRIVVKGPKGKAA